MATIKIKGIDYEYDFDYGSIRTFAKVIGLKRPSEIENFFSEMDLEDPSFEDIDGLTHFIRSAIKSPLPIPEFGVIQNVMVKDPNIITQMFETFDEANKIEVTEESAGVEDGEESKKSIGEKK